MISLKRAFHLVAFAEAASWTALVLAMVFKYTSPVLGDGKRQAAGAVSLPGMVHGVLFLLFIASVLLAARWGGWSWQTTVFGLLSSIPPLGSLLFDWWATRRGLLAPPARHALAAARAEVSA